MLTSLLTIPRRVSIGRHDATPSQATTDARSRRGSCHAAGQLAYVQERNRTHADGMEIFLPTLFTAPPDRTKARERMPRVWRHRAGRSRPGGLDPGDDLADWVVTPPSSRQERSACEWRDGGVTVTQNVGGGYGCLN